MANYQFIGSEGLSKFWENIKEYYSSDENEIHIGDNTTVTTRNITEEGSDNIASTKYVKDLVLDTITGGLASIPVKEVRVNDKDVIKNQVALIDIPIIKISSNGVEVPVSNRVASIDIPVTSVKVNGTSVVNKRVADIIIPEPPIKVISINSTPTEIVDSSVNIDIPSIKVNDNIVSPKDNVISITIPTKASDIEAASQSNLDQTNRKLTNTINDVSTLNVNLTITSDLLSNLQVEVASNTSNIDSLTQSIGEPSGIAQLDEDGKLPASQLTKIPVESYESTSTTLPIEGESGVLYLTKEDNKVLIWKNNAYEEVGGIDSQSRRDIIKHLADYNNPHKVTKTQLGLDKVDNTSDTEKPVSKAVSEALKEKLAVNSVIDNLLSSESSKPLSAKQGNILSNRIATINEDILSLGSVFHFRGTLPHKEYLNQLTNPQQGDVYQIKATDAAEEDEGVVYAYNGSVWYQIAVSISDISTSIADLEEVYAIIDNYKG